MEVDPMEDPLYGEDEIDPELNQPFEGEPTGGGDMEMTEQDFDPFTTLSEDIDEAIAESSGVEGAEGVVEAAAESSSFWANALKGIEGFFGAAKEVGADAAEIAANIGEVTSGATQLATGSSELAEVAGGIAEATEVGAEFLEVGL
jgi:X-X-X-Leu-X-X-Gly heptad repeat protein